MLRYQLFDVRLADASPTGAAFVTERRLAAGDLLELETFIEDQPVRFEVRVVHTGPAVYGRNRVGSEITTSTMNVSLGVNSRLVPPTLYPRRENAAGKERGVLPQIIPAIATSSV